MSEYNKIIAQELRQQEWKEMMQHTGMDKLKLTQDQLSLMRLCFTLGFDAGADTMMDILKDIREQDTEVFENLFNGTYEDEDIEDEQTLFH